jgi:hypothetical protein
MKKANAMTARLWCGTCRRKRPHRCNPIGMWVCAACGCYRDKQDGGAERRRAKCTGCI